MNRANLDTFYKKNIGLIHVVAKNGFARLQRVGSSINYDDLFQELSVVFIKAYDLYDESKNIKFSTYFTTAARNTVNRIVKSQEVERMDHKLRSFEELDANGDDESGVSILDTIASDELTPKQALERKQAFASLNERLSPLALKIVEWVFRPPAFLEKEYDAYGAYIKYAQSKGAKSRKMDYSPRFICNVLEKTGTVEPVILRSVLKEVNQFVGGRDND